MENESVLVVRDLHKDLMKIYSLLAHEAVADADIYRNEKVFFSLDVAVSGEEETFVGRVETLTEDDALIPGHALDLVSESFLPTEL